MSDATPVEKLSDGFSSGMSPAMPMERLSVGFSACFLLNLLVAFMWRMGQGFRWMFVVADWGRFQVAWWRGICDRGVDDFWLRVNGLFERLVGLVAEARGLQGCSSGFVMGDYMVESDGELAGDAWG